jgi:hypothetical protein
MVVRKRMKMIRTYSELIALPTFLDRYRYLRLGGKVGEATFGFDRYLNQLFYKSEEWLAIRDHVILRDTGNGDYCLDLGMEGHEIHGRILVHHMNPITTHDILNRTEYLLNPEYLICTVKNTHDAIHYGDESLLVTVPVERTRYDTCPWRR